MSAPHFTLFSVIRFTPGRRINVYRRMRSIAARLNDQRLVKRLTRAIDHDRSAREVMAQRGKSKRRGVYNSKLAKLDPIADTTVASIHELAKAQAKGLPADHPTAIMVSMFLAAVFAKGVKAITQQSYVDQAITLEDLVDKLQNDVAAEVIELGLANKVAYLAEITEQYSAALELGPEHDNQSAQARAADDRGHLHMLEILATVLGTYNDSDVPEEVAKRDELLAPFFANLDIVRAKNRARLGRSRAAGDAGSPADADTDIDDTDDTDTSTGANDSEIADALMSPEIPNNGDSPDSELVN